jgi:hypothetical protein
MEFQGKLIIIAILCMLICISISIGIGGYLFTTPATTPTTTTPVPIPAPAPAPATIQAAPATTPAPAQQAPIPAPLELARKTVKERLQAVCPVDPAAEGKINKTNGATYEEYLFSGCTDAQTCDKFDPDPISNAIINKKGPPSGIEHCGAWVISGGTGYDYIFNGNTRKWDKVFK